jgi:hypothetical protein
MPVRFHWADFTELPSDNVSDIFFIKLCNIKRLLLWCFCSIFRTFCHESLRLLSGKHTPGGYTHQYSFSNGFLRCQAIYMSFNRISQSPSLAFLTCRRGLVGCMTRTCSKTRYYGRRAAQDAIKFFSKALVGSLR